MLSVYLNERFCVIVIGGSGFIGFYFILVLFCGMDYVVFNIDIEIYVVNDFWEFVSGFDGWY